MKAWLEKFKKNSTNNIQQIKHVGNKYRLEKKVESYSF